MSVLCLLTHNSFVFVGIHPQNCRLLWDRIKMVTTWSWDLSTPLLQVGARLFTAAAVKTWYCPDEEWRHDREKWHDQSNHVDPSTTFNSRYFYMCLKTRWRQEEVVTSQMLLLLCSDHFCSERWPTGNRDHSLLGGAIIYGSTSCPASLRQTGFTILSYTISDLSLCSSDRHSVWPFYHLNGAERFKKGA